MPSRFRRYALLAALAVSSWAVASPPTNAQVVSNSESRTASDARAAAITGSAAVIQQTFQGAPPQQRNTVAYEGQFRQDYRATIRNTPDAYAPAVTGGTNPCTQGLSGGGSVAGFGVALGGSWSDPNCERRNLSALLHNQGQQALAQEVLCETEAVRQARLRLGQPCAADRPVAGQQPVPTQVIGGGAVVTPVAQRAPVNDFCLTVGPLDNREVRQTCGWTGPNFTRRPAR